MFQVYLKFHINYNLKNKITFFHNEDEILSHYDTFVKCYLCKEFNLIHGNTHDSELGFPTNFYCGNCQEFNEDSDENYYYGIHNYALLPLFNKYKIHENKKYKYTLEEYNNFQNMRLKNQYATNRFENWCDKNNIKYYKIMVWVDGKNLINPEISPELKNKIESYYILKGSTNGCPDYLTFNNEQICYELKYGKSIYKQNQIEFSEYLNNNNFKTMGIRFIDGKEQPIIEEIKK